MAAPDGDQQQLGLENAGLITAALDRDRDAVVGDLDALERGAGADVDLALAEGPLEGLRRRLVLGGHEPGEGLDDRDLGAEALPDARELAADDAAAEHDDRRGHPVEAQRVFGGDHPLAVDVEAGQRPGVGAGGEDHVPAGVRRAADGHLLRPGQATGALDDGDPARRDEPGQPLEQAGDHAVLVGVHAGHVDALERRSHAELCGLARRVGHLRRVQQRLGRDAADVQAGAAEVALLDQPDGESELGGPEGTCVATGARAQDEYVEVGVRHAGPSGSCRGL
jgi:hypothetical protein